MTPTQDLLLEVLASRWRLGEHLWTFDSRHRLALDGLADQGLVHVTHGVVERTVRASLTDAGCKEAMSPGYVPPILAPDCSSYYIGPDSNESRVDCERRNHHKGKHRWKAPWKAGDVVVRWTDAEAKGRVSVRYAYLSTQDTLTETGQA